MNLNQTLCTCDCVNVRCKKNMGISHIYAAEARDIDPKTLDMKDLSDGCFEYVKREEDYA